MVRLTKNVYLLFAVILAFLIGKLLLWDIYFFLDSISTLSIPAHFLYENDFSSIVFPNDMVNDNLLLSASLAFFWKLFGRSIFVTHIFFIIIGVILIYQIYKLCRFFVRDNEVFPFIFLLVISDTALVTQALLFMTDTVMVLFAVMSIRYMLENKKVAFSFSLTVLSLLRARGFSMCIGIGLTYFVYLFFIQKMRISFKQLVRSFLPFIPVIFFVICSSITSNFYYYFREDSPWSSHYHFADLRIFIRNVATIGRFFLDYGRIFLWILFFYLLFKFKIKNIFTFSVLIPWIIFGSTLLCMLFVTLPFRNPMGFRYFILQYIFFALIVGLLLFYLLEKRKAKILCVLLIIGLWSGHFWVYPDRICGGLDATLLHVPFYDLRREALNYLDKNNIDFEDVAFPFPLNKKGEYVELNNDQRNLDGGERKYLVFSNMISDDELFDKVTQNWILIKRFKKKSIFFDIYENPDF